MPPCATTAPRITATVLPLVGDAFQLDFTASGRPKEDACPPMTRFPVLNARKVLRILLRLGYTVTRQRGSHRVLDAPDRGRIVFAFHDGDDVPAHALRHMLVDRAGLTIEEALRCLR